MTAAPTEHGEGIQAGPGGIGCDSGWDWESPRAPSPRQDFSCLPCAQGAGAQTAGMAPEPYPHTHSVRRGCNSLLARHDPAIAGSIPDTKPQTGIGSKRELGKEKPNCAIDSKASAPTRTQKPNQPNKKTWKNKTKQAPLTRTPARGAPSPVRRQSVHPCLCVGMQQRARQERCDVGEADNSCAWEERCGGW